MVKVHDRDTGVGSKDVGERVERPVEAAPRRPRLASGPAPRASRFVRWLAWLAGVVVLLGTVALIWWGFSPDETPLVAPAIEEIDPHQSPEILRTNIPGPTAPSIDSIDPHQSPEILRRG